MKSDPDRRSLRVSGLWFDSTGFMEHPSDSCDGAHCAKAWHNALYS